MSQAVAHPKAAARRPVVPSPVLAVALFLFSEVMLFAGLVSAHVVLRGQAGPWPPAGQPRLPVGVTGVNTLLLLLSGVAMWRAVPALRTGNRPQLRAALATAFALGTAFVAVQGYEWVRLVGYGLTRSSSLYGSLFYTLVGAHGLHVLGALAALAVVSKSAWSSTAPAAAGAVDRLSAMRLYWLFVVGIWPPLYALVYLW